MCCVGPISTDIRHTSADFGDMAIQDVLLTIPSMAPPLEDPTSLVLDVAESRQLSYCGEVCHICASVQDRVTVSSSTCIRPWTTHRTCVTIAIYNLFPLRSSWISPTHSIHIMTCQRILRSFRWHVYLKQSICAFSDPLLRPDGHKGRRGCHEYRSMLPTCRGCILLSGGEYLLLLHMISDW